MAATKKERAHYLKRLLVLCTLIVILISAILFIIMLLRYNISEVLNLISRFIPILGILTGIMIYISVIYNLPISKYKYRQLPDIDSLQRKLEEDSESLFTKLVKNNSSAKLPNTLISLTHLEDNLKQEISNTVEKASILLVDGKIIIWSGIIFYITTIIIWQALSLFTGGFKSQYIYGMAECSAVFIFIEFIAAWYLKQYRYFIDKSTFLTKVKSIFDKYILCYLLAKDEDKLENNFSEILAILKSDVPWPDDSHLRREDKNMVRELISSINKFAKLLKNT